MTDILTIQDRLDIIREQTDCDDKGCVHEHIDALEKMFKSAEIEYAVGFRQKNIIFPYRYQGVNYDTAIEAYHKAVSEKEKYLSEDEVYMEERIVIKCTSLSTSSNPLVPMCGDD